MQQQNIFSPPLPKKAGDKLRFGNLSGSSMALAISCAARAHTSLSLVVTHDRLTANQLENALKFFAPELEILSFPDWETLPYDNFSPHQDIISDRLHTLSRLSTLTQGVLIAPISTLLQRLPPKGYVDGNSLRVQCQDKINLDDMRRRLEHSGYRCVAQVMEHGEFAVRGSILDLYPMGSELPYRLDLFGDEIDTIRTFDPDTQRTIDKIEKIDLLPAREFPLTEAAITRFRQNWREQFSGNPIACPVYQDVSQGFCPPGVEYYLPLFFEQTATLLEYLPNDTLIFQVENIHQQAEHFWEEINERYEQGRHDVTRPLLPPAQLYLSVNDLFAQFNLRAQISLQQQSSGMFDFATEALPDLAINHRAEQPLHKLKSFLENPHPPFGHPLPKGEGIPRILFCAESAGRREALLNLLQPTPIVPSKEETFFDLKLCNSWQEFLNNKQALAITVAPLENGLCLIDPTIAVITETELFGQQVMQRRRRKAKQFDSDAVVRNLAELSIGSPVVHIDHGVGRYQGLQTLKLNEQEGEFLILEYAGGDKLYVPVSSLHLISRYSGVDLEHAPLHRLGTDQWDKAKRKAAEQVRDVAAELLDIYARRAARVGHAFTAPDTQYQQFAAGFPFEETADQQQAIEQVIQDMTSGKSMDRLICGDVGFGKTEVAMRAAFLAVQDGKQVAILVPTTLLAQQHYQSFRDRFAEWPIQIEAVSRFRTAQEQKAILNKLEAGSLDIIIGTHKLIQKDVKFKNLGLLIIDEEHRFGVQQKEKLKALRAEVDILTLTATPIPRTLNMAMSGLREFSIIATPPARRLSIKTFVRERNKNLIREAIVRELLRGGQIYFLHNEVVSIERVAEEVTSLVPEARVGIAHGQMHERELERVMTEFYHRHYNVLVCTTIIETGIDVPTANTIIMDRADKFGLAQLHQLRGRVGRSHHQAYAYLMTPPKKSMTADAIKRLDAISALEDLGAGFTLATHDLEIRGAGELLGEEQSGNMQAIGFSLYMELLDRAVTALKSGKRPELDKPLNYGTEIDLQIPALIPESYVPDVHTRLVLYKRIASAKDQEGLRELQIEFIDRFGLLPEPVKNLFNLAELKLQAQTLGIRKIECSKQGGRVEFDAHPNVDPGKLIKLVQLHAAIYKFDGPTRLRFTLPQETAEQRIKNVAELLGKLS
jgi:transcription-repair coupling factor (superfamily II helicase)